MRRNPLSFTPDEFKFLHKVYLKSNTGSGAFRDIKKKRGVGLTKSEIEHVKKRFDKWKSRHNVDMFLDEVDNEMIEKEF